MGHARTEAIVAEAQHAVQEVVFSAEQGTGRRAGGGTSQSYQSPPPAAGGYPVQPQPTGQSYTSQHTQSSPKSGTFYLAQQPPVAANTYTGFGTLTTGDRPGETLMRANSAGQGPAFQMQAGSVPTTPQSFTPSQGLPQGQQGYASPNVTGQSYVSPNYPTRASFVGLPQLPQQQTGTDLGMASYLGQAQQEASLPPIPQQQLSQQQYQAGYPQQQQQSQLPYQQSQSSYQQQQLPEPQTYPSPQPNQLHQPMPQSGYANFTYPQQSLGAQPQGEVNEFGTYTTPSGIYAARSSSLRHARQGAEGSASPDNNSGRFATFPIKASGPRPQQPAASPAPAAGPGTANTLEATPPGGERAPSLEIDRQDDFSSSVAEALGQWSTERGPYPPQGAQGHLQGVQARASGTDAGQHPYHAAEQSETTIGHSPYDGIGTHPLGPPSYDDAVSLHTEGRESPVNFKGGVPHEEQLDVEQTADTAMKRQSQASLTHHTEEQPDHPESSVAQDGCKCRP